MKNLVDVEKVCCDDLHLGRDEGEPHFSISWTKEGKLFCKVRGKDKIELDAEKIYNFFKEQFQK